MASIRHMRGTRAQIDAAAATNGLLAGQIYLITDEARLTVGTGPSSHQPVGRQGESGGSGVDPWQWLLLPADSGVSTATLAPISPMSFIANAGATYLVDLFGTAVSAASTTGMAVALDIPSGTVIGQMGQATLGGTMAAIEQNADATTSGATSGVRLTAANVPVTARFLVSAGGTGGPVTLMMRSEVAGSTVTLKGGLTAMGYRAV
jgi:hypothetical protein